MVTERTRIEPRSSTGAALTVDGMAVLSNEDLKSRASPHRFDRLLRSLNMFFSPSAFAAHAKSADDGTVQVKSPPVRPIVLPSGKVVNVIRRDVLARAMEGVRKVG